MKKTLLLALFSLTSFSAIHAEVTYTLENGVLTITGTGDMTMPDYNLPTPWDNQRDDIKEVIIENGVKNIGAYAFGECKNLTSATIPNTVTTIGNHAFYNCPLSKKLIIPSSVKSIGDYAFWTDKESDLEQVVIFVNKELEIGEYVFDGRMNLSDIMLSGEHIPASMGEFGQINDKKTLHVPSSLLNEYSTTYPWSDFNAIEPMLYLTDEESYTEREQTGLWGCYTRDFENTEWQALYLPFSLDYEDWKDDFEIAYINGIRQFDTDDDGWIDETWMDIIQIKNGQTRTNYPYVIRAKKTGQASLIGSGSVAAAEISIACSTTTDRYTFTGTFKNIDGSIMDANGYYAVINGELTQDDENAGLKPYRWYMQIEETKKQYDWNWGEIEDDRASIKINLIGDEEGEVTGIEELRIKNSKLPVEDSSIYDLNGRKVNEKNLKPGLYIKNGKKVVIK